MGITPQKEWAFVIKALRVIRYSTSVAVASDGDVKESLSYIDHSLMNVHPVVEFGETKLLWPFAN